MYKIIGTICAFEEPTHLWVNQFRKGSGHLSLHPECGNFFMKEICADWAELTEYAWDSVTQAARNISKLNYTLEKHQTSKEKKVYWRNRNDTTTTILTHLIYPQIYPSRISPKFNELTWKRLVMKGEETSWDVHYLVAQRTLRCRFGIRRQEDVKCKQEIPKCQTFVRKSY